MEPKLCKMNKDLNFFVPCKMKKGLKFKSHANQGCQNQRDVAFMH